MNAKCIDVCVNKIVHRKEVLASDGSNAEKFYKADMLALDGDEFRNYGGYPRNEIAIINEQNSIDVAKAMVEKMVVLNDDSMPESKISDADLRLGLKSRYQQTISETIDFNEKLLKIRDERIAEARKAAILKHEKALIEGKKEALWNSLTAEEKEYIVKKRREKELETLISD